MLTDNQSLYFCGIVIIGFFIAGLFSLLDNLIVQIVLGCSFFLVVLNLFITKQEFEDLQNPKNDNENL